jgi:hypothetical protein
MAGVLRISQSAGCRKGTTDSSYGDPLRCAAQGGQWLYRWGGNAAQRLRPPTGAVRSLPTQWLSPPSRPQILSERPGLPSLIAFWHLDSLRGASSLAQSHPRSADIARSASATFAHISLPRGVAMLASPLPQLHPIRAAPAFAWPAGRHVFAQNPPPWPHHAASVRARLHTGFVHTGERRQRGARSDRGQHAGLPACRKRAPHGTQAGLFRVMKGSTLHTYRSCIVCGDFNASWIRLQLPTRFRPHADVAHRLHAAR